MIRRRATLLVALVIGTILVSPARVHAASMQARDVGFKKAGTALRVALEVRDLFNDRFRRAIDTGGTLYVRVETELWEVRSVWDRLVRPAVVSLARLAAEPASHSLVLVDPFGAATAYQKYPRAITVWADLAPVDRFENGKTYYVQATVTVGTIAEDEINGVSSAVFGEDRQSSGLGSLGKFVVKRMLKLADYLDSSTCEVRSRRLSGAEMKR